MGKLSKSGFIGVLYVYIIKLNFNELRHSIDRSWNLYDVFPAFNPKIAKRFFNDFDKTFGLILLPGKHSDIEKAEVWYTRKYHLQGDEQSTIEVDVAQHTISIQLMGNAKEMTEDFDKFIEEESTDLYSEADYFIQAGGFIFKNNPRLDQKK